MNNIGKTILVAVISAIVSVSLYKWFEEPQQVIIRETVPAVYTKKVETEPAIQSSQVPSTSPQRSSLSSTPTNFIKSAETVTPAVVNIKAVDNRTLGFWRGGAYSSSTGSGVIISPDGYIVTNNHVIEDGNEYEITFNDKREYKAKLIGIDASTDLALLKVEAEDLPYVNFGNSDLLSVGEWVMAVGNPFNLESTVTAGIVSAKGRSINILEDQYSIESFIQTDAAVNPGNSGGALVNTKGELVGINTAIITQSGRYEGYSFAVPANLVQKVIFDLKDYGVVQRGMLGVGIDPITDALAKELDLDSVEGVYIKSIEVGGAAADAGLKTGDVIISLNGNETNTMPELQEQVARLRPGNVVEVEYIRKGRRNTKNVTLKNKLNSTEVITENIEDTQLLEELGFELREMKREERDRLNVNGVIVKSVYRGGKIERTNMDPGFIITKVNEVNVKDIESVIYQIKNAEDKVMLEGIYENYPGEYYYAFAI